MKKAIILIVILVLLLYLAIKFDVVDKVRDYIDRFSESHKVNLIEPTR